MLSIVQDRVLPQQVVKLKKGFDYGKQEKEKTGNMTMKHVIEGDH